MDLGRINALKNDKKGHNGKEEQVKITTTIKREFYEYVLKGQKKFSDLMNGAIAREMLLEKESIILENEALRKRKDRLTEFLRQKGLIGDFNEWDLS